MAAAGAGDVRLLGMWPSPFVMRVQFALGLKKVPYEFVESCVFDKSELLLKSNPIYKKIPVLLHGDRSICESMIIVEYIEDAWMGETIPALVPSEPYDKAMAKFWATYIDSTWFPCLRGLAGAKSPEELSAAADQVFAGLQLLEDVLSKEGKPFFGGDTAGYLDVAFGGYLPWTKASEKLAGVNFLDKVKIPLVVAWSERFLALEAVKVVVPETEKLVQFFGFFKEKMAAAEAEAAAAAVAAK